MDTAAFISGKATAFRDCLATTHSVISEVRDRDSLAILETLQSVGRLEVVDVPRTWVDRAIKAAKNSKVLGRLSGTDLEVLALAIGLKECGIDVAVATDDYSLQKASMSAGVRVVRLRYKGVGNS